MPKSYDDYVCEQSYTIYTVGSFTTLNKREAEDAAEEQLSLLHVYLHGDVDCTYCPKDRTNKIYDGYIYKDDAVIICEQCKDELINSKIIEQEMTGTELIHNGLGHLI